MRAASQQPPPQQMTRLLLWRPGGHSVSATRDSQRRPPQLSAVRVSLAPSRAACHCPPPPP
eukprot:1078516-Prymnesium_polylepis.1